MATRRSPRADVKTLLLHEAGFRCANPVCRMLITLEIHHIERVADGGSDEPENLLVLCPNCHAQHHAGLIPIESLRAWKYLLLALNSAFDRQLVDVLLTLAIMREVKVSGDGVLSYASGFAAGLIKVKHNLHRDDYWLELTPKGSAFVKAWKEGDQDAAIRAGAL